MASSKVYNFFWICVYINQLTLTYAKIKLDVNNDILTEKNQRFLSKIGTNFVSKLNMFTM